MLTSLPWFSGGLSTHFCHHASPGHKIRFDRCPVDVLPHRVDQRSEQAVKVWILFVLIMSECIKPLLEICAHRWWYVVVDARLVITVLVVVVVGEVGNFARALDARRCALESAQGLYREAMYFGRGDRCRFWGSWRRKMRCELQRGFPNIRVCRAHLRQSFGSWSFARRRSVAVFR